MPPFTWTLHYSPKKRNYVSGPAENEIDEDIRENESISVQSARANMGANSCMRACVHFVSLAQAYTLYTTPTLC